jgi:hypothetical protein
LKLMHFPVEEITTAIYDNSLHINMAIAHISM